MMYVMRYKDKFLVKQGNVEAGSKERAEELGRGWCERKGYRYLGMEDLVLVREEKEEVLEVKLKQEKRVG